MNSLFLILEHPQAFISSAARKVEEIDLSYKVPEKNVALLFHLHFIPVSPVSDFYQTIINLCCFKVLNLWKFLTASIETNAVFF